MSLGRRLISTGGAAVCTTDSTDPFGDSSGVALYNLDYDASTAPDGTDYSGSPSNVTFGVGGQINYGARFNGSSSFINLGDPTSGITSANYSVSFWINTASTSTSYLISKYLGDGLSTTDIFRFRNLSDGTIKFRASTTTSPNSVTLTSTSTINDGNWHHICATVSPTTSKLYIDGVQEGGDGTSTSFKAPSAVTRDVVVGYHQAGDNYYDGDIDQVRIFNRVLSTDNNGVNEIATLYAETACVYTATTTDNYYPLADGSSDAVAYYKLDNSAEDSVSTNDGTESNIEYRFGRFGQAAVFNGSSSKIDLGGSIISVGSFTVSLWLNANNVTAAGRAFHLGQSDNVSNISIFVASGNLTLRFLDSGSNLRDASITASTNTWYHAVITFDSSTNILKSYVNGTEELSVTTSGFSTLGNYGLIGARAYNNDQFFNGKIDQVRIYSTALSSSQVTELYNEKPETDTSTFKTVLWQGDGGTQYISNVGFQPDFVWVKDRDVANYHILQDSVRGEGKSLFSNGNEQESGNSGDLISSFDSNGFTVNRNYNGTTNNPSTNESGGNYVAWVWKGSNADAVSNTDGTITSQVSANTEAGFSIVKYTGTGSNDTFGHGLSQAPEMIIQKRLDGATNWFVKDTVTGVYQTMNLNLTNSATTITTENSPTSQVISLSNSTNTNNSGSPHIAYCFHSVSGYSKIGSYSGTGVNGNRVYLDSNGDGTGTGAFEPRWLLVKRTNTADNWVIVDSVRGLNNSLFPDDSSQELSNSGAVSFNTDGFTVNGNSGGWNNGTSTYLYMAFK